MPRLTNNSYLTTRSTLRTIWLERMGDFAHLTPAEQRALHLYFRPSAELHDTEALLHRQEVTATEPSLPHRAGRAVSRLQAIRHQPSPPMSRTRSSRKQDRRITVRGVLRPEIDHARLARILPQLAHEQLTDTSLPTDEPPPPRP